MEESFKDIIAQMIDTNPTKRPTAVQLKKLLDSLNDKNVMQIND